MRAKVTLICLQQRCGAYSEDNSGEFCGKSLLVCYNKVMSSNLCIDLFMPHDVKVPELLSF